MWPSEAKLVEAIAGEGSSMLLVAALFAAAVQNDFVVGDAHWDAPAELLDLGFEGIVGEEGDGAAVVTDEVVVVSSPGGSVRSGPSVDLEFLDKVGAFEFVEDAVDAGPTDGMSAGAERVFDLDRRQALLLLGDDRRRLNRYVEWTMVVSSAFAYVSWPVYIRTG
jgi:hypothetical protein